MRDSGHAEEAALVCDEMAMRARRNVEVIVDRLSAAGYRFHANDSGRAPVRPFIPPTARASEVSTWLCEQFHTVPMTLLSWMRIVGDVWLVGTHPDWPESSTADPLVIQVEGAHHPDFAIEGFFAEELAAWGDDVRSSHESTPFVLPLAPDRLHKSNVSGGDQCGVVVPDGCVDGMFVNETVTPFVAYLNRVFSAGGFPWPTGTDAQRRVCRGLADGMLPL